MTPKRLQEIKERCDAATPGPWQVSPSGSVASDLVHLENGYRGEEVAVPFEDADATFIAHARTDVPELLEYIAELENSLWEAEMGEDL